MQHNRDQARRLKSIAARILYYGRRIPDLSETLYSAVASKAEMGAGYGSHVELMQDGRQVAALVIFRQMLNLLVAAVNEAEKEIH